MRKYRVISTSSHYFPKGAIVTCDQVVDHSQKNSRLYRCHGETLLHHYKYGQQIVAGWQLEPICNKLSKQTIIL